MSPDYAGAEAVIVNTCGFLDSAKAESLDAIGEALKRKRQGHRHRLLGRRTRLHPRTPPQILAVTGPTNTNRCSTRSTKPSRHPPTHSSICCPRRDVTLTPRHYSYLKDIRGLQPQVQVLHHPRHARTPSNRAPPTPSCAKPKSWSRQASKNSSSSPKTPPPTGSTAATT